MYYVTGDIHGDIYPILELIKRFGLSNKDTIILLGDVGLNFYENSSDSKRKKILNETGVNFLCIHGNHEIRPSNIPTYKEHIWNNGIVYRESKYQNINFSKDGEIYDLGNIKAIAIGGAYSVDKKLRINSGKYWWPDEQPSEEIKKYVENSLSKNDWNIDVVFSHTCPERYIPIEAFINGVNQSEVDRSTEKWLGYIESKLNYSFWYCGHWHINKRIDKLYFLYDGIDELFKKRRKNETCFKNDW